MNIFKSKYMICCMLFIHSSLLSFDFSVMPEWFTLASTEQQIDCCGGKLIVVAQFKYKNRTAEQYSLSAMTLNWKGPYLNSLQGSLYRKLGPSWLPLEKYLMSDGFWNSDTQNLYFNNKTLYKLNPLDEFYVVFILPDLMENVIKKGFFEAETHFINTENFSSLVLKNQISWNNC